jgi:hypothetical protein
MKAININNNDSDGEDILHRIHREKRERDFVKCETKRRKKNGLTLSFFWC